MMFKRFLFVLCFLVFLFALSSFASAVEYEYPVYVGDQGFSSIELALQNTSSSGVLRVVGDLSLTSDITLSRRFVFEPSSHVTCNGFVISVSSAGSGVFDGTLYQTGSHVAVSVVGGNVTFSGDIIASNYTCVLIYNVSSVSFVGVSFVSKSSSVIVRSAALGSTLYVEGGSFISSSGSVPLSPLDAFSFPDGVVVQFLNGYIVATSSVSVLSDIGRIVSEAVVWISLLVRSVMDNTLLLVFFIVVFVGLGIGLIRRSIYL